MRTKGDMNTCVFCKIISGQASAHVVHEDEQCLVILDIDPVCDGHMLILPKNHTGLFHELDDQVAAHISLIAKQMGEKVISHLGADGYNILHASGKAAQQSVPHVHFHVVPRYANDGKNLWYPENTGAKDRLSETMQVLTGQ